MNPRLFCREQSYHKALLLTYSFDPIFFEQVVLPDLWAGRSSDILVMGDKIQVDASTQAAAGQLWHLGRNYLLAGADISGAFHPKLFLRLGPKDGVVMLGSGNVTSSGWGGNQELGTAWMVGPDHLDKGGWLHLILDDVSSWCASDLERDAVLRIKDVPWLSLTPPTDTVILHSRQRQALGPVLAQRWEGRQFDEVKILTGSTDESGAFLRWVHTTFGVKRAIVAITPSSAAFVLEKLADLPLELRIVAAPTDRLLHAKFFWFDGPNGAAAIMGSANCSAAAWLLSPDNGGNVETVVVYDQADKEEFESALKLLNSPGQPPADVLLPGINQATQPAVCSQHFVLKSLHWDAESRQLHAEIIPTLDEMSVELLIDEHRLVMNRLNEQGKYWVAELAEGLGSATVFASALVMQGENHWKTPVRWIDDVAALDHASHVTRSLDLETFKGSDRNASSAEQRQILDELQEVAQILFNDNASFRDPSFRKEHDQKRKDEAAAKPVNPNDLIVHLDENHEPLPHFGSASSGSLSLTGILRLLFDTDAEIVSEATEDEVIDNGQIPDSPSHSKQLKKSDQVNARTDIPTIEARFRERLATQISTFLTEMSSSSFAERCTATQLVQAVSFPLAVSLRGERLGWVSADLAEKWALEIFSILFQGKRAKSAGLIRTVEQRYLLNDKKPIFDEVVGDGTLWIVLVATLGNAKWQGVGTQIDKALALREVFTSPQLLSSALPSRVTSLLGKIRIEDAKSYLTFVAPTVTRLLQEIEDYLKPIWESEIHNQGELAITHRIGDILWRENVGWATCLAETQARTGQSVQVRLHGLKKNVMSLGYYANVSDLATRNLHLDDLIKQLRDSVSSAITTGE